MKQCDEPRHGTPAYWQELRDMAACQGCKVYGRFGKVDADRNGKGELVPQIPPGLAEEALENDFDLIGASYANQWYILRRRSCGHITSQR